MTRSPLGSVNCSKATWPACAAAAVGSNASNSNFRMYDSMSVRDQLKFESSVERFTFHDAPRRRSRHIQTDHRAAQRHRLERPGGDRDRDPRLSDQGQRDEGVAELAVGTSL